MRKRLVIGAIAAVVIGVATYVLSQCREASVEHHKENYWQAFHGPHRWERLSSKVATLIGRSVDPNAFSARRESRMAAEEDWLIKSGYLEKRTYFCPGTNNHVVIQRLSGKQVSMHALLYGSPSSYRIVTDEPNEIVRIGTEGPVRVFIVAPKARMLKWEKRFYDADRTDIVIWNELQF